MDFTGLFATVVTTFIIKLIEKGFEAKDNASNETLTESQIRRQKFLKQLGQFEIWATVIIALVSLGYSELQQKYFPRVRGCIESTNAYVYDVPSGNKGGPVSQGCYFFDMQDKNGYWFRLSSENENLDRQWVQSSLVKFSLCKSDNLQGNFLSCVFSNKK